MVTTLVTLCLDSLTTSGMALHTALFLVTRLSRESDRPIHSPGETRIVKKFTSKNDEPSTIMLSEPVDKVTGLTNFGDVAPEEQVSTEPSSDALVARTDAGYLPEPIPKSLGYNFRVDTFSWTYANAIGSVVHTTQFPTVLKDIQNITMKLLENRFMTADIEVKIKIASTPFHFGSLGVAFVPRQRSTDNFYTTHANPYQLQSFPNVSWLRIGVSENLEITLERIPFTTFDFVEGSGPTIGTLVFFVRTPLRSSGTSTEPTPLLVNVFANFKLPTMKLAGRGESAASMRAFKSLVSHMSRKDPNHKQSGKGKKRTPDEEAKEKSEGGVISTVLQAAGAFAPLLMETPLAEVAPFAFAAGALAPVFKSLGLSKPLDVSTPQPFLPGQRRYMHQGSGLAQHQRLGNHQDSALADVRECGLGRPDIRTLAKQPAWLGTFYFDDGFASEYVLKVLPLTPSICFRANASSDVYAPGLMAYYSQFFKFWRGGFKIMIDFDCSQFTSGTVAIVHNTYNEITPDMETTRGNRVNHVVEIRGNTRWKKSFPYLSHMAWSPVIGFRGPNVAPLAIDALLDSVEITIINPAKSTADDGDSSIYYSIYIAADDDIDFKDYCGFQLRKAANEIVADIPKKQSLKDEFSGPWQPILPAVRGIEYGYVKSDTQTNLVELCHQEVKCSSNEFDLPMWFWYTGMGALNDHIHMLLFPFLAFRGSINYRVMFAPVPSDAHRTYSDFSEAMATSSWMSGHALLFDPVKVRAEPSPTSATQPDLCFNVPYQAGSAALPWDSSCPEDNRYYDPAINIEGSESGTEFYRSLGDDAMVGLPFTAPLFTIADPPVTRRFLDKNFTSSPHTEEKSAKTSSETVHGSALPDEASSGVEASNHMLGLLSRMRK
jgi:hypothetical protein